ncbi:Ktr system potassium uptake protein like [Actinidia chinensis var. chinensis]|uniref:Ktr system potassium uptake protein like n=1 Tax=Actinidia chinensis var. chinensis TaxID=1590841 RepID=A0A2R6RMX4_ACTCC|nr:Ktr system potassium uptake protein like [Actinidia chinensis var. chinensis]
MMIASFFLLILQTLITSITAHPTLNISRFIYPKIGDELRPQPSPFLEDVLKAISVREGWNNSGDVRVSKLDSRNAKCGSSQRYEFRLRIGKAELIFELRDEVSSWKKMKKGGDFESVVNAVSSMAVLDAFRVEGPLELRVGGDDELSLLLPLNASHTGLKRILVGEDITVEVRNAQGVSLDHALELALQVNRSVAIDRQGSEFWPLQNSLCETLLPIHISGSATVAAYRARNPDSYIETTFLLRDTIELLPEKCYLRNVYRKRRCPIDSINLRTAVIEKLWRSFLGDKIYQNGGLGFLKANIKASTVVRFKMELERDIRSNDTLQGTLAEWRTRHTVERVWFEVVARIERERLKPLVVKKVRPSTEVDSSGWSNLMSNISFTKFPSILVPPEALTLDVKW